MIVKLEAYWPIESNEEVLVENGPKQDVTPPNLNDGNVRGRMTSCGKVTNEYIVKKAI